MLDIDYFKYEIPNEILPKIPECFWAALAGELVSIFGLSFFDKDDDGVSGMDYSTGTAGWVEAFKETCYKLNMTWLYEYYRELDWIKSDQFDGEIADLIEEKFVNQEGKSETAHAYYLWLIEKGKHNV